MKWIRLQIVHKAAKPALACCIGNARSHRADHFGKLKGERRAAVFFYCGVCDIIVENSAETGDLVVYAL